MGSAFGAVEGGKGALCAGKVGIALRMDIDGQLASLVFFKGRNCMDSFLGRKEILARLGVTDSGFDSMRRRGVFPNPTHKKGLRVYWDRAEIEPLIERLAKPQPIRDTVSA